ncbi:KRR1 small subunit processome component [Thelohanellus kitauei]|uniref:KRR1 small subunit processome component n=1 Tax=Thelohanellus kitauei TaxID=669202 RepID=A0A0C2IJ79_THEKT|nr:KRR1 small subunit processome component [Thelohanellus kitauei]
MKSESWDGLIPKYKPKKMKKKTKIIKKRENTSFPPPQMPSKIDIQLETGEYFLKEHERRERKLQNRLQKQKEKAQSRKNTKDEIYEPGDEKSFGSPSSEDEHISRKKIQKNIKDIKSKMRYPKKQ